MTIHNLKVVVVEDEVIIAEYINDLLTSVGINHALLAHNKKEALEAIESFNPDVILLDIRLKLEQEGIQIGQYINEKYGIPFIYITSHSDKEVISNALTTKPFSYLTKPIKKADLFAALQLLVLNIQNNNYFIFKDGKDTIKINTSDILYVQSNGNYVDIVTTSRKFLIRQSLEKTFEELQDTKFQRIHRTTIVNAEKITRTNSNSVFINDIELPLSRGLKIKL